MVCGPSGTGKTFFLEALGQQAVGAGMRVAWFTLEALGVLVGRHRADDSVTKAITRILRADLAAVDDIGLLPVGPDAAEALYRLVDAAYEKRSVAVSSNLHPSAFDELMPKTLATATVDRLLHHAHLCQTSGESIRLAQALAGPVSPPRQFPVTAPAPPPATGSASSTNAPNAIPATSASAAAPTATCSPGGQTPAGTAHTVTSSSPSPISLTQPPSPAPRGDAYELKPPPRADLVAATGQIR